MCYNESIPSVMMTSSSTITKQRSIITIPEDDNNNNHLNDSIVSTSSMMVGNFFPIINENDSDDNCSEVDDEYDNQERHHNRQLSSSSSTRSSRRSMSRLLSWTSTSLPTSPRKQQQQQLSNSISNKKEKKRLFQRRSFRHSQSCNDIDINSKQTNSNSKSDRTLIKKRSSFLFRRSSTKSSINDVNDQEVNEDQQQQQQQRHLRLRTASSFDGASTSDKATSTSCSSSSSNSNNDNDSNCSVVSSIDEDMMMDFDNNDCSYDECNNQKKNIDNHNQQQKHEVLPDLYGQIHEIETPELIEISLQQMNIELIQHNNINERLAEKKWNLGEMKVNCTTIKILFLRSCCFRISEAVDKYILYWNKRILLFGIERAFNPLTVSSLTLSELNILESGTLGIVKRQHAEQHHNELIQQTIKENNNNDDKYIETRDIIIFDYTLYDKKIMATLDYTRVVWYIFHSVMEDIGSSQRGVIFIVVTKNCVMRQLPSFDFMKSHLTYFHNCIPLRLSGMHIIYMPTIIRFVVPILNRLLDDIIRQRLIFHTDIKTETQCITKLYNKYGIRTNMIPTYIGGTHEWNMKNLWIPKQILHESNKVIQI